MTTPTFVTFTSGLAAAPGIAAGVSIRVAVPQGGVNLIPITPGYLGTDSSLASVTMISVAGQPPVFVSGSVATTASALGVAATQAKFLSNISIGSVAYGSLGTDAVSVSGTQYFAEGYNPCDRLVTNIAMLNGSTASTNKAINFICGSDGVVLGTTDTAGTTCTGGDAFQSLAVVTPFTLPAGKYFGGFQVNGNTTKHRTVAASTYLLTTGSLAGVFGTIANITVPTTFTADVGPIFYTT